MLTQGKGNRQPSATAPLAGSQVSPPASLPPQWPRSEDPRGSHPESKREGRTVSIVHHVDSHQYRILCQREWEEQRFRESKILYCLGRRRKLASRAHGLQWSVCCDAATYQTETR